MKSYQLSLVLFNRRSTVIIPNVKHLKSTINHEHIMTILMILFILFIQLVNDFGRNI